LNSDRLLTGIAALINNREAEKEIHWSKLVQVLSDAGIKHVDAKVNIDSSHWSKIVNKKIHVAPSKKGLNKKLEEEKKKTIVDFWHLDTITRISSGKLCVVRRKTRRHAQVTVPVRYRLYSISKSFDLFKEKYGPDYCSEGSFFTYKPKWIKKSKAKVDCCPICKRKDKFEKLLSKKPQAEWTDEEKEIKQEFEFHDCLWKQRQLDYDNELATLPEGKCLLVMDFKANITLGKGPEQDADVFFKAPQRTVFGVVGFFKKNDITHKLVFNAVSPILNHDSIMVRDILTQVVKHQAFTQYNIHTVSFWMDNAPNHFRTKETYATMLHLSSLMAKDPRRPMNIEFNYFGEYHGKSVCDQFFGTLARIYEERTSSANSQDIRTTAEFIRMFNDSIHKYGGYVVDDQVDFVQMDRSVKEKKLNVHTFELIPNYVTKEELSQNLDERKSILTKQVLTQSIKTNFAVKWELEPNQKDFPNKYYPKRLTGSVAWGNFYSFKVASSADINRFAQQENEERSFLNKPGNTKHKLDRNRRLQPLKYGPNVFLACLNATHSPVRISVRICEQQESRTLKIGGDMVEKSFRNDTLHRKSRFHQSL
jgi:hypothetical protein